MKRVLIVILFSILTFCSGKKSSGPIVARINGDVLTLDMIEKVLSSDNSKIIGFDQKKDYVERWVERELLYSEAKKRGLEEDFYIKDEILNLKKELAIDKLIEVEVDGRLDFTDEEIKNYYKENAYDFEFKENEYKYEHIKVIPFRLVGMVEERLRAKKTFSDISKEEKEVILLHKVFENGYTKESSISNEILNVLTTISMGEWKRIKLPDGYHFVYLIDRKNEGSLKDLSFVRNEIIVRILTKKRKILFEDLMKRLKENADIEINYSEIGFLGGNESHSRDSVSSFGTDTLK